MKKVGVVRDFVFPGAKIEDSGSCKGDILKRLALGRAAMTGLNQIWKDKDITITTKCRIVNALVFPVVLYGCESWTIRKAERRRISFELWCWRRLLRIPWTARRTNKSVSVGRRTVEAPGQQYYRKDNYVTSINLRA